MIAYIVNKYFYFFLISIVGVYWIVLHLFNASIFEKNRKILSYLTSFKDYGLGTLLSIVGIVISIVGIIFTIFYGIKSLRGYTEREKIDMFFSKKIENLKVKRKDIKKQLDDINNKLREMEA